MEEERNCGLISKTVYEGVQAGCHRAIESGKSLARVARELEIHENALRRWKYEIQQQPGKAFVGNGNSRSMNRKRNWSARSVR
jgi:transposase-like protein